MSDDEAAGTPPVEPPRSGAPRVVVVWMGVNALLALVALWIWFAPAPQAPTTPAQPTATAVSPPLATVTPSDEPTHAPGAPTATPKSSGGGAHPTATPVSPDPTRSPTPTATPAPPTPTPLPTATPVTPTPGNQG